MCYSALVEQRLKTLERGFKARIDEHAFYDLFRQRSEVLERIMSGEEGLKKIVVAKALDWNFLGDVESALAKDTKKEILRWWGLETQRVQKDMLQQRERVLRAEAALQKKLTKKAQTDLRVGTAKIERASQDLDELKRKPSGESDSWIWPKHHFPGIVMEGERWIRPFRYLIRPAGQPLSFDDKYSGAYNAQQERLQEVFFWRELLGRHHGYFQVHRFRERQDEELMTGRQLKVAGPPVPRKEYEFDPGRPISVPFLWDHWVDSKKIQPDLYSAAAITCDPSEAILAQGVRRLLTPLDGDNLLRWEKTSREDLSQYQRILADYSWENLSFKVG